MAGDRPGKGRHILFHDPARQCARRATRHLTDDGLRNVTQSACFFFYSRIQTLRPVRKFLFALVNHPRTREELQTVGGLKAPINPVFHL